MTWSKSRWSHKSLPYCHDPLIIPERAQLCCKDSCVIVFVNTNSSLKSGLSFIPSYFLFFRTGIAWIRRFRHDGTILSDPILSSTLHKTWNCILFCLNAYAMLCLPEVCPYRDACNWARHAESQKITHFSWHFALLINQFW